MLVDIRARQILYFLITQHLIAGCYGTDWQVARFSCASAQ